MAIQGLGGCAPLVNTEFPTNLRNEDLGEVRFNVSRGASIDLEARGVPREEERVAVEEGLG